MCHRKTRTVSMFSTCRVFLRINIILYTVIIDSFLTIPIDIHPATSLTTFPWFIRLRVMKSSQSHKPSSPSSPPCSSPRQGNPPAQLSAPDSKSQSKPRDRVTESRSIFTPPKPLRGSAVLNTPRPRSSHRPSDIGTQPKHQDVMACRHHL